MESPELSIIVPVYNAEKYLRKCIDSILAQTFTNFECIIVDDGSTDSSSDICEHYSQADTRIIVVHQENSGVSAARNKGIEIARGKFIGIVDSDDYIQINMYENLIAATNEVNIDVVCCGYTENIKPYTISNEDFIFSNSKAIEIIHYLEMRQAFGMVWNKIYKKTILDTYKIKSPVSIKFGDDMLFNLQYFKYVKTAYISSNRFYYYLHDNQNAVTKGKLTFAEANFRFENVSTMFLQIDDNSKSVFYSELLAKDFKYTIALFLRLYAEKKGIEERLVIINKLKNFYKENNAKNKFRNMVVAGTYKMLLYLPAKLFDIIFYTIFLTYVVVVKLGKGSSRFVNN